MSLINQMLKDLEQRGATSTEIQQPSITPQFGAYTKKSGSKSIYIIGVSLITIAIGYALLSDPAQLARVKEILGFNQASNNDNNKPTVKFEASKFGQPIQDKSATAVTLPEAPAAAQNQPTNDALGTAGESDVSGPIVSTPVTNTLVNPNEPPANLFERTLKFTPQTIKDQPAKNTDASLQKKSNPALIEAEKVSAVASQIKQTPIKESEFKEPAVKESVKSEAEKSFSNKNVSTAALANKQPNIHKKMSPEQTANSNYQQALIYLQQGRVSESEAYLAKALEFNPAHHEARLTLASLLLDNKRLNDAKDVLNTGLQISPEQNEFRIALARLQVSSGDQTAALTTLEQGLPYAANRADYYAFLATLLQRSGQHDAAITHYTKAISIENNSNSVKTNTLVGLGISLQAVGKLENAQQAFSRAQQIGSLSPALASFVDQQLKKIQQNLNK